MSQEQPSRPIFVDFDSKPGQPVPTTYESVRSAMLSRHPISDAMPDDIRELLFCAVDYFALAYEQANTGRGQLYERLTNDAFLKATLALELSLRHRLGRGNRVSLEKLIALGMGSGLLPATEEDVLPWMEIRQNRNAITHGDPVASSYGPATGRLIGHIIDTIVALNDGETISRSV